MGYAQFSESLKKYEDSLSIHAEQIINGSSEDERISSNQKFLAAMREVLQEDSSFSYSFSELTTISKLNSKDKELRILNWTLPKDNGSYEYFGFVQRFEKDKQSYSFFELNDIDSLFQDLLNYRGTAAKWPGALYYEIIETESEVKKYYTLLGWDGNNRLTTVKVIDVLSFDLSGEPVFGDAIFKNATNLRNRVVFEYAATNKMSLKYREDLNLIMFDHLAPSSSRLKGLYEYYGPDLSFDALEWNGTKWELLEDVDTDKGLKKKASFFKPEGKDTIKSDQFIRK